MPAHLLLGILQLLEQKLPHGRHELHRQIDESFRDDQRYTVRRVRYRDRGEEVSER